jgi:hypothetical protein
MTAILVALILACLLLIILAGLFLEMLREMRQFRFQMVDHMMPGSGDASYLQQMTNDLASISFLISEIKDYQEKGAWQPSEPP